MLYTLPLLLGTGWAPATRVPGRALKANAAGLAPSTAYLAWGLVAQQQVERIARGSLTAQGIAVERVLVTPTAFNSLLWRVVAVGPQQVHEGFRSLLDKQPGIHFDAFDRGASLEAELRPMAGVPRIRAFSKGFYKLHADWPRLLISDLRMGQEPTYSFSIVVAERHSAAVPLASPVQIDMRPDLARALPWLWRRMWGEPLPPPR